MQLERADIVETAIGWHLRQAEMSTLDWAAFVDWLEADPAHAAAFDAVAQADRMVADATFPVVAANDDAPLAPHERGRWRWFAGSGAVAALIAALLVPAALVKHGAPYDVSTKAGERRTVALGDGTSIEMSGGTTLKLDRNDARVATLENGEATFHVRHDAGAPFTLTSGALTVRDLGTVFNVARDGQRLSVAVSEGAVMFQPDREAVRLGAGDVLTAHEDSGRVTREKVSPDTVGGWRSGSLSFQGQSLGEVAATLNRLYAFDIVVDADLSARPFTGMVRLSGAADRDVPHLAALIGAGWRRDGSRWILSSGAAATR
ncbi:MAG: FecR domain-containing protein [Sphingomonas sp.]|uniref:FecR family protein n=1 Tax=Sphingomonas sp. TaxID=28214 RepID=UPI001ACD24C7|nr:FecR domain-containing protein [Sphingomonas sp.]MBN8808936.1 FecR domain-containing protein [Sphingomonas sp.]